MIVTAFVAAIYQWLQTITPKLTQECGKETVPEITMQDLLLFELTGYEDTKRTTVRLPGDKSGIVWFREDVMQLLSKIHVFDFRWRFVVIFALDQRVVLVGTVSTHVSERNVSYKKSRSLEMSQTLRTGPFATSQGCTLEQPGLEQNSSYGLTQRISLISSLFL
jgi:hypothetical protein